MTLRVGRCPVCDELTHWGSCSSCGFDPTHHDVFAWGAAYEADRRARDKQALKSLILMLGTIVLVTVSAPVAGYYFGFLAHVVTIGTTIVLGVVFLFINLGFELFVDKLLRKNRRLNGFVRLGVVLIELGLIGGWLYYRYKLHGLP